MKQEFLFNLSHPETDAFLEYKRKREPAFDFRSIPASSGVYGIHPYPAMFHFRVVRQLLSQFSSKSQWVFDPFMGSGVAAVESLIHQRHFIGYDINPLAILIAKVRTTPLPRALLSRTLQHLIAHFPRIAPTPINFRNIHYWFDDATIEKLSQLRQAIFHLEDSAIRNFFLVSFAETVRRVSRTKYNEFKLLRKKQETSQDVLQTFQATSLRNIDLLTRFYRSHPASTSTVILQEQNILHNPPLENGSIDLVLTSPPYGDSRTTVAYGQFSRLALQWLGIEERVDKTSLGSKACEITSDLPSPLLYHSLEKIEARDEKRAREVFAFYKDLLAAIRTIGAIVKPGGHVCFVVGNRRVKEIELPTDKISADFFESVGFTHLQTIVRAISNKRMPSENSPSNVKGKKSSTMRYEYIVVLQKQ